jgi:hypothetical protein
MEQVNSKLLTEAGFFKKDPKTKQPILDDNGEKIPDAHEIEVAKDQVMLVNWPAPSKYYRLIMESWKTSVEESYFWLLNYLRYDLGYSIVHKVTDLFSSSEQSSFFGLGQQRVGLQQDKVSSFLAIIGKMTKELFQLVREMRILDERLSFYKSSEKRKKEIYAVKDTTPESRGWESAEITLKGFWVDLVEQGTKNPASVYGMAREVQFTTLPDLFFSIHPFDEEMVDRAVDSPDMERAFNRKVREVLKRKLRTYLAWKKQTYKELLDKRGFTLRYTYQHVNIIKLYMSYVKPYLKNIERMQLDEDARNSPDLIAAFESSMVEIEILGQFLPKGNKSIWSVFDLHFMYRTKPSLNYNAEGYNRGPIHEGEIQITYRTYAWTQKEINAYLKMRSKEDFYLLKVIDKNLDFVLMELGDDLFRYLDEAEDIMMTKYKDSGYVPYSEMLGVPSRKKEAKSEDKPKASSSNPFSALLSGFSELAGAFSSGGKDKAVKKAPPPPDPFKIKAENDAANSDSSGKSWLAYKNFKKGHKLIAW